MSTNSTMAILTLPFCFCSKKVTTLNTWIALYQCRLKSLCRSVCAYLQACSCFMLFRIRTVGDLWYGLLQTRCPFHLTKLTTVLKGTYWPTRMWANAQRDGRPAEYRWRRLFNAAVWLTPTTGMPCSNAAKTRNPLKFAGVPQTNETISASSGPKFTIL